MAVSICSLQSSYRFPPCTRPGLSTRNFSWSLKKKSIQCAFHAPQKPSRYIVNGLCKRATSNNANSPATQLWIISYISPLLHCVRMELFIWQWLNKQKILKLSNWRPKLKERKASFNLTVLQTLLQASPLITLTASYANLTQFKPHDEGNYTVSINLCYEKNDWEINSFQ